MAAVLAMTAGIGGRMDYTLTLGRHDREPVKKPEPSKSISPWHDPELVEKAKQKRAMRAAKRAKLKNT